MVDEMVQVRCLCCDAPLLFPKAILAKLKIPATFCWRCFCIFPMVTLRKWVVLDMIYWQVQQIDQRLQARGI